MNKLLTSICVASGVIAAGALVKISIDTSETKEELRVVSGKVTKLENELNETKAQLIRTNQRLSLSQKERSCLIKNVYHEAGVDKIEGKISVAQITLNRVNSKRWKSDICGVVFQKAQFSWTLQKKKLAETPKGPLWEKSVKAVEMFESGVRVEGLEKAKFYHTDYIKNPKWADPKKKVMKVGRHIFYNEDKKTNEL